MLFLSIVSCCDQLEESSEQLMSEMPGMLMRSVAAFVQGQEQNESRLDIRWSVANETLGCQAAECTRGKKKNKFANASWFCF